MAFVLDGQVRASTLPASALPAIGRLVRRPRHLAADDRRRGIHGAGAARWPGRGPAPVAVVLHSRTEHLRFLTTIHAALGVTALVAVLGRRRSSAIFVARTITRPLAAITRGMREMAATGDLTRKIALPAGNWEDEDARLLASTFNTLTDSIARFQREAAQRERLSSLGRLSTVIAHEIRNPLMIIKAALRALRKARAAPEDVAEAVTDIDEEVDRLNRIVTRCSTSRGPIRFELADDRPRRAVPRRLRPRPSAGDTGSAGGARGPRCPGGRRAPTPSGSAAVLVNLLTNARHAVLAARGGRARRRPRPAAPGGTGAARTPRGPRGDRGAATVARASRQPHLRTGLRSVLHDAARGHRPRPRDRPEHRRRSRRDASRFAARKGRARAFESSCRWRRLATARPEGEVDDDDACRR